MTFPVVGREPTEWTLREAKLVEYEQSFPGVIVLAECRAARQWCIDNPTRRKTLAGMPAFLTRWLSKAQNSGKAGASSKRDPRGNLAAREDYLKSLGLEESDGP